MPTIDVAATARRIDELRIERGMTIKDIQIAFGFNTPQAVYKWVNGKSLPTLDNIVLLSYLFCVTVDDILVIKEV